MSKQLLSKWTDAIVYWASTKPEIVSVYLFGSRAKGAAHDNSDLDLAIVTSGDHQQQLLFAMCEGRDWKTVFDDSFPIQLDFQFAFPETDTVVWPAVQDHGILIYGEELR